MALLHVNFFSDVLGMEMGMDVILPQHSTRKIGMGSAAIDGLLPTLYLLHGLSDDHTIWQRRTSIERYVADMPMAVVMPTVHRGFYTDQADGYDYFEFISRELPDICESFFPLSSRREDRFAAGLSMGGYGAMKLGLRCPDRYAAVASLSGVMEFAHALSGDGPFVSAEMARTFGTPQAFNGSDNDIFALAQSLIDSGCEKPRFFSCCGSSDFLIDGNRLFSQTFGQALGLTYEEGPGEHTWGFWDEWIQRVLSWLPLKVGEGR